MQKVAIRYFKTGKVKTMAPRYAEILVRSKLAEYVEEESKKAKKPEPVKKIEDETEEKTQDPLPSVPKIRAPRGSNKPSGTVKTS